MRPDYQPLTTDYKTDSVMKGKTMDEDKKPTGRRMRRMENISTVFSTSDLNKKLFGQEGFQFFLFQKRWEKMVGPLMAKESYVSSYKKDMLFVTVTNSVFMQHLFMIKSDILKLLADDEFGKRFTDIRFIAGPYKKKYKTFTTLDPINENIQKEKALYSQPLTEGERNWIDRFAADHVTHEKIQKPFADMMKAVLQIRKGDLAKGFHPCRRCGTLCTPDETLCPACARVEKKEHRGRVIGILKKNPHFYFQDLCRFLPCTYPLYEEVRNTLIRKLKDQIFQKFAGAEEKKMLLALLLHKEMSTITDVEAEEMLKRLPEKRD